MDNTKRQEAVYDAVRDALENGPTEGLTGPQISSVVPGTWDEIYAALEVLTSRGVLKSRLEGYNEPYPIYSLEGTENPPKPRAGTPDTRHSGTVVETKTVKATYTGRHVCFISEDGSVGDLLYEAYKHVLANPDDTHKLQGIILGAPAQDPDDFEVGPRADSSPEKPQAVAFFTLVYDA